MKFGTVTTYEMQGNQVFRVRTTTGSPGMVLGGSIKKRRDPVGVIAPNGMLILNKQWDSVTMRQLAEAGIYKGGNYYVGQQMMGVGGVPLDAQGRTTPQALSQDTQTAYDEAKTANEARYKDILAGLEGMGQQEDADIRAYYSGMASRQRQDLTSRGMANSTVLPTMQAGVGRQMTSAIGRLNDRIKTVKFGFMERVNQTYPNLSRLSDLMGQLGRYSG